AALENVEPGRDLLGKRADGGATQRRDVPEASERAAEVAGERAHIGALAALGGELGVVAIGHPDKLEAMDLDRPGLELDHLAVAREVVGALALDLHRGEARRHLLDPAGEARQEGGDRRRVRTLTAHGADAAFGVVGIALLAPAHEEAIDLAP